MGIKTTIFAFLLLMLSNLFALDNSITDGDWETNTTWGNLVEPTIEDTLIIQFDDTVTVSSNLSYDTKVVIIVYGALKMDGKLNLVTGSKVILLDGRLLSISSGNSDKLKIGTTQVWSGKMGDYEGIYTFDEIGITLPVTWSYIDIFNTDSVITMEWQTNTETNNDKFVIEVSDNILTWKQVDTVLGNGNSSNPIDYTTTFSINLDGTVYVRIVQYDYDGNFDLSKVLSIEIPRIKPDNVKFYLDFSGKLFFDKPKGLYIVVYENGEKYLEFIK